MNTRFQKLKRIPASLPAWVWQVLKGAASAALVYWLIVGFYWSDVVSILAGVSRYAVLAWFGLWFASFCLLAWRLKILLEIQAVHVSFRYALRLVLVGVFTGNFLPSTMGGDAVKFAFLTLGGHPRAASGATLIFDRLLNILANFLFLPFVLFVPALLNLDARAAQVFTLVVSGLFIAAALLAVLFLRSGQNRRQPPLPPQTDTSFKGRLVFGAHRFANAALLWNQQPRAVGAAMGLSVLSTFLFFYAGWVLAEGLHIPIPLVSWFAIQSCLSILGFLPVSFNGVGLQEVSMVVLLGRIGVAESKGLALALLLRVLLVMISLLGAYGLFVESRPASQAPVFGGLPDESERRSSLNIK